MVKTITSVEAVSFERRRMSVVYMTDVWMCNIMAIAAVRMRSNDLCYCHRP